MQIKEVNTIAQQYGTPTYIFDKRILIARIKKIKELLGTDIGLCYSMKANPFLVKDIAAFVDKIEVCSPGELSICEEQNIDMNQIIFSGVNKSELDVKQAIGDGVGVCTAESILQMERLEKEACERDTVCDVLIRINSDSQFGMSMSDFERVISNESKYRHLSVVGIHYFSGTQKKRSKIQVDEIRMLKEYVIYIEEKYGFCVRNVEYGPGLSVPYFEKEDFSDTLHPLREIMDELDELSKVVNLTIEIGRFMTFDCGYYLSSVVDEKITDGGTRYCIIDGGMNHLSYYGQTMGMKVPIVHNISRKDDLECEKEKWCICGSICSTADVLIREKEFNGLQIGDVLVFENVGAYTITEGIYLFLSRDLPKVLAIDENNEVIVLRDNISTVPLNNSN